MKIVFSGVGLWTRGLTSFAAFEDARRHGFGMHDATEFAPPRPAAIPARERRRAGLLINLAVEVAHQACAAADIDKTTVPSVFVSALGDTAITDYMCRKLATPDKLLSPTKFHNSVHNAPSGYWAISAVNRAPSTFVGGFLESFGAGLFEAASQAHATGGPVLLTACDMTTATPLDDVAAIAETLGIAFVVKPANTASGGGPLATEAQLRFVAVAAESPAPRAAALARIAKANPMGCALALVERFRDLAGERILRIPAAPRACIELQLLPAN